VPMGRPGTPGPAPDDATQPRSRAHRAPRPRRER
jgi:hypothetical protein